MKFILSLGLLSVLTSAASVHPSESTSSEFMQSSAASSDAVVEDEPASLPPMDLNDILQKVKQGISRGLADNQLGGETTTPFEDIFRRDYFNILGGDKVAPNPEAVRQLKEAIGDNAEFKDMLESGVLEKLFDEEVVKSMFKGGNKLDHTAAHAKIDDALSQILKESPQKIKQHREKAFAGFTEMLNKKGDNSLNSWEGLFKDFYEL